MNTKTIESIRYLTHHKPYTVKQKPSDSVGLMRCFELEEYDLCYDDTPLRVYSDRQLAYHLADLMNSAHQVGASAGYSMAERDLEAKND